jgi:FlaA1/EpsC-like NDP-sugar epimerase
MGSTEGVVTPQSTRRGANTVPLGYWTVARHKRTILALADAALWGAGITAANLLRYQFNLHKSLTINLLVISVVAALLQILVGILSPLYRSRWRVGSLEEILCLAPVWAGVTGMVTAVSFLPGQHVLPASATIGGGAMALIGAGAVRVLWRLSWERKRPVHGMSERTIIFGAGEAGAQLVDSLIFDPASGYLPVAVLDDDPAKLNLRLRRLRVMGGRKDLVATALRFEADSVVIAIPSASSTLVREIADLAKAAGITTKVLPPLSKMLASSLDSHAIRTVSPEDFLGRRVIDTRVDLIAGYLTGKRVLVTGAGGSIGSELCRQIQRFEPSALIMLDRDESGLHQVQLSIEGRALLDDRELALCDIRDARAVMQIFDEHRPEVVFHAAALKHLPMLEMWPLEAVKTNVRGTQNVLDAAAEFGVERFVNISTDKAANPTSVLGYSKRLGERLTASVAGAQSGTYLSVRFGNVLGSRGSVLKTFEAQLAAGLPLTVTHPDVVRYFMTVEEAVQLVIQAGAVGRDSEVLVLDMGEPVRIAEVANQMLASSGSRSGIIYTGLRQGEKLIEELFADGEIGEAAVHPLITHVPVEPISPGIVSLLELEEDAPSARNRMAELSQIKIPAVIDLRPDQVDLKNEWNPIAGN